MNKKIISFKEQKEKNIVKKEGAFLILDGKEYELDSFILSGLSIEGNRIVLSWNSNLDEMINYNKILEVTINSKVLEAMED